LGPGSEKLVRSGDPVKDRDEAHRFLDAYAERHSLVADGQDRMTLHVGTNDWPLPIPLVRRDGEWAFDSQAGAQVIVDRRIGRNEIAAIRFALAYVDAQRAYFDLFKQVTGKGRYAMRLVSTDDNYDGLYWPPAPGIPESPLGPLVASAIEEGYPGRVEQGKQIPYEGYYFRVLTAQGPNAPGGAKNYVQGGVQGGLMTGGFGLIAWPAIYDASGITSFVVGQDGVVFQKDLGPETSARTAAIRSFDPGLDWARVVASGGDARRLLRRIGSLALRARAIARLVRRGLALLGLVVEQPTRQPGRRADPGAEPRIAGDRADDRAAGSPDAGAGERALLGGREIGAARDGKRQQNDGDGELTHRPPPAAHLDLPQGYFCAR
jgi:hypothetical protein